MGSRRSGSPVLRARRSLRLGSGSLECLLFQQALAVRANSAFHVVWNPSALPDRVNRDRGVLVPAQGHFDVLRVMRRAVVTLVVGRTTPDLHLRFTPVTLSSCAGWSFFR
jgi:hypothetical protein